jgi:hypothetical protein
MALRDLLASRRPAICGRWLDSVLGEYGPVTAARWRGEQDRFANPVGHALSAGLPRLLEAVASDRGPDEGALSALQEIVRIRSVQDLTPSRAVGFVFLLRRAVREELAADAVAGAHAAELAELDGRIERLALLAFDAYVAQREEMFRLRQEELKRSVASILRRWNGGTVSGDASEDLVRLSPGSGAGERR